MCNLKYVIRDIKNNKILMIIFTVLNIVMLLLVEMLLHVIIETRSSMKAVDNFKTGFQNAYIVADNTSEEKFCEIISDTDKAKTAYSELFQTLVSTNHDFYTVFGYDIDITKEGNVIQEIVITEKFLDVFNLSLSEGRKFEKNDFTNPDSNLPIMVGYYLKDTYKLGETYEFVHGGTGELFTGTIVGILEKNSNYYELNNSNVSISLDYAYIIPQNIKDMSNLSFSDLDMAETRLVVFGEKNDIQKIFSQKSPIDVILINVNEKINYVLEIQRNSIIYVGSIAVMFLIFSLAVVSIGYSRLFKKQQKEYRVHLFCGASKRNIVFRFILLSFIMLVIGVIFVGVVFHKVEHILIMMIFSCIFCIMTGIYPYVALRNEMR